MNAETPGLALVCPRLRETGGGRNPGCGQTAERNTEGATDMTDVTLTVPRKASLVDLFALWFWLFGVWPIAEPEHWEWGPWSVGDFVVHAGGFAALWWRWEVRRRPETRRVSVSKTHRPVTYHVEHEGGVWSTRWLCECGASWDGPDHPDEDGFNAWNEHLAVWDEIEGGRL